MGLSEQERKIFDEIEQHLTEQDPRFVSKARKKTVEGRRGRRLRIAFAAHSSCCWAWSRVSGSGSSASD